MSKYTGVLKPSNFEIFRETLAGNNMGDQGDDFLMASGKLQALCYKAEIEAALRTSGFGGFQLLQLHDFPGQGTALVGVLDAFFGSKGYIEPEEFRRFCNVTVPLARMEKRIFQSDEVFLADIEIAHFGEDPIENARFICRINNSQGEILTAEELTVDEINIDNHIPAGSISFPLSGIVNPQKLTLEVRIEDTDFLNSWDFWVYPDELELDTEGEIHITNALDGEAAGILDRGGTVLLLPYGQITENYGAEVQIGFSSIFWNTAWTRNQAPHTLGILCDPEHPVFNEYPTEYHSNWQWWDPIAHSQAMIMDEFPGELKTLIQPIDTWFENRRLALAFEAKTGNGKLMVCSIDMKNDLEDRPSTKQLYHSILEYMKSDSFNPDTEVKLVQIRKMIRN
jgi:hypothetical protein